MTIDIKTSAEYQDLLLKYKLAIRYIRTKTNQLLDVLGTIPLLADDISDSDLIQIDPIGIVSDTFASVLENLREKNLSLNSALSEIEAILNATPAGIIIIDASSRLIVNANPSAAEIIGLPLAEIVGRGCCEFFCTANKQSCPVIDEKNEINKTERAMLDAKGNLRTILKSVKEVSINDRTFLIESFIDITENKLLQTELIKSQRIESLSLLAGGIAHDLNNSLMAILGNISMAKHMVADNARAFDRLTKAESAVQKAQALSTQLLTFAKGGAPVLRKASIADILSDTVKFASSGKNMKVILEIEPNLPLLKIDEVQISQVFQNLTINASEAMPQGGTLTVTAKLIEDADFPQRDPKIKQHVKIVFKDTGIGIKPEIIDRIFDPFFTTKQTGSGLGLATTYSIIKKHNAHIFVSSSESGTEFTIYLPVDDSPSDTETTISSTKDKQISAPPTSPTSQTPTRVLVLEDDSSVSSVIKDMFAIFDCQVDIYADGHDVLEAYKQALKEGFKYNLVLLDLTIPGGMGGMQTMTYLKLIDPEVKAVLLTGYNTSQIMHQAKQNGFLDIVGKPFKIDKIKELISTILP